MKELLYDIVQTNFAPLFTVVLFVYIVKIDTLIERRVQKLFLLEICCVFIMKLVSIADVVLESMSGPNIRLIRLAVNTLYFGVPPIAFIIITNIFEDLTKKKWYKYYLIPEIASLTVCTWSCFSGAIFSVTEDNVFIRGPLYAVPFIFALFYYIFFFYITATQKKTQSVKTESIFLTIVFTALVISTLIEIFTKRYFILWTTTYICVILYFSLINIHKILYDSLSDAYTRLAFSGLLERYDKRHGFTVAMIDINNLKYLNDTFGHLEGDKAVISVAATIIKNKSKSMKLFRYGGDEFVLTGKANQTDEIRKVLEKSRFEVGDIQGEPITFAFGITEYHPDEDLHVVLNNVDRYMYEDKKQFKKNN
ncbi:MAG: GGDEF domain-containing protein [Oscillospiraceae bacterium]|nr:GGDEF domain-containing protein [Oscillospiraceae bacterium]